MPPSRAGCPVYCNQRVHCLVPHLASSHPELEHVPEIAGSNLYERSLADGGPIMPLEHAKQLGEAFSGPMLMLKIRAICRR